MNGISDTWNDIQSQLSACQPAHSDFLTEVYPTNGLAYWLNAEEEPLQHYVPPPRVNQPDCKVFNHNGNDMYPLSPSSPNSQVVSKTSSSPALYTTHSTRPPLDGGMNIFSEKDSSRALAAASYYSPPFSNMNFNFPTTPFVSGLMIDDSHRFYDASIDARQMNPALARNQSSATHIHPRFATNSNGIPPFYHMTSYHDRPNHDHIPSIGRHPYVSNPKVVVPPAKHFPSRARTSAPRMLECTHDGCRKTFSMPHLLRNHLIWHSDARPFQCPHCKASFKRNCDMNRHIKSTHIHVSRRFVCQDCQMTWNRVDRYNSHMRTVHMGKKGVKSEQKHIEDIALLARYETEGTFPTLSITQPAHLSSPSIYT